MIELNNLSLSFENWKLNANLLVGPEKFSFLIGPSGAGKSSILNAIAGFLPHGPNEVLINGQDMKGLGPEQRPVSMLFQENNLFNHLTILQNTGLGIDPNLNLNPKDWQRVEAALERVGLEGMGERLPRDLSGGQRQRAGLARIMLRQKPVMLLDEPFAALGPALRKDMLDLVKSLAQEAKQTVIMVTHQPDDARHAADLVAFVSEGTIQQAGSTQSVLDNPNAGLKSYLG